MRDEPKILFIFTFLLFLNWPSQISIACGPFLEFERDYSFLRESIFNHQAPIAKYLINFDNYYKQHQATIKKQYKNNLTEWRGRFCDEVSITHLKRIIYDGTIEELTNIRKAAKSPFTKLEEKFKANGFANHLVEKKCIEVIDYLIFAKKCEPHVVAGKGWQAPERSTKDMQALIKEGLELFKTLESHYVKMRLAYQIIRLAHYCKDYQQVLVLYDYLMPKFDKLDSIINYWILGHKAGALQKLGRNAEASYLFAKIFIHCPEKRESAFLSFKIDTDEEWSDCLLLCQNDKERSNLYAIRANSSTSKPIEEMISIYELNPESLELETLLYKEMKAYEDEFVGNDFNPFAKKIKKAKGEKLIRLHKMVNRFIEEKKVTNPELWKVADAYIEIMLGDLYAAEKSLNVAREETNNSALLEQLDVFDLVLKILNFEEIDNEDEEEIANILRNKTYRSNKEFEDFLYDKIAQVYKNSGDVGKAFLARHGTDKLMYNPKIETLDQLLEICEKEDKNRFEKSLVRTEDGEEIVNLLRNLKGAIYFMQHQPEAALKVFDQVPRNERKIFNINPFYDGIKECVHCDRKVDTISYTRVSLVKKMLDLEYKGRADLENTAWHFYQLGLSYYNTSYYGHGWEIFDAFRSGSNWGYKKNSVFQTFLAPNGNREMKDLSRALEIFEKVRLLAQNPELGARACLMAAKCQQKMYFADPDCDYSRYSREIPKLPKQYRKYVDYLIKDYAETKYYRRIIKECKYFKAYSRN